MNQRFRYFLRSLLPVASILFMQSAMAIFGMQVLLVIDAIGFKGKSYWDFMDVVIADVKSPGFIQMASLGASLLGVVLFTIWYLRLKASLNGGSNGQLVIEVTLSYRLGLYIAVFAFAAQYISVYLTMFLGIAFPEWADQYAELQEASGMVAGAGYPIVMILNGVLLAPICEELCFRGLTYNYAALSMPERSANLVQALLFAGLHGNPIQSAYGLIIGLALGKIYSRCGKLSVTIFIHIFFNACGFFLSKFIFVGSTPVTFYVTLITAMMCFYYAFNWILGEVSLFSSNVNNSPKEND